MFVYTNKRPNKSPDKWALNSKATYINPVAKHSLKATISVSLLPPLLLADLDSIQRISMEDDFIPRTVEDIFNDFSGRRSGLLRAFTTDFDRFYSLCDPESENLCVYGHTNGKWEVRLPPKTIPPLLPQPILGINFARDGMRRQDWLLFISVHSDAWLISLYSYFSARLSHGERKRLFGLINDLPTLFEVMESPETQNLT